MGVDLINKITNTYERKARLHSVFFLLAPALVLVFGAYGVALKSKATLIAALGAVGAFYLAASIVRVTCPSSGRVSRVEDPAQFSIRRSPLGLSVFRKPQDQLPLIGSAVAD